MVTFDGVNKIIICDDSLTDFNVRSLYAYWKQWVIESDNAKFIKALSVVGGNPTTGDNIITPYFFLLNGWKVKPHEANHTLKVDGILLTNDDSDVFIDTDGSYRIGIQAVVPIYTETVKIGSGLSNEEHAKLMDLKPVTLNDVIMANQL